MNLKKFILTAILLIIALLGFSIYQYFKFNDDKLHLVFCNVGQGDGIFIRSPNGTDIVLDSGPDDSILNCLSSHMPFWDRSIELALLTHPHEDHMRGFISILKNYEVKNFATENIANTTATYGQLFAQIKTSNLKVPAKGEARQGWQNLYAGDRFKLSDGLTIKVVGPTKEFLEKTSPEGKIGETHEFGSLELLFSLGSFSALTTGDSQIEELNEALPYLPKVGVFQIPHHGSKFGTDDKLLSSINPKFAAISVGKNKYGHPTPEVLKILEDLNIKFLRTDQHGDIEIVVDKTGQFTLR